MAARKIAGNINPKEITGDGTAYQFSAPTVNPRGKVVQGNNRADALKEIHISSSALLGSSGTTGFRYASLRRNQGTLWKLAIFTVFIKDSWICLKNNRKNSSSEKKLLYLQCGVATFRTDILEKKALCLFLWSENVRNFQIKRKGWHGGFHAIGVGCNYIPPFAFKVILTTVRLQSVA